MKREKTKKRSGKKYVLVLVEGDTDSIVLRSPLQQLLEATTVTDKILELQFYQFKQGNSLSGDITSTYGINPDTICGVICKGFLDEFFRRFPYIKPNDIHQVIQIIDMDGAFIPDEAIFSSDDKDPRYEDDGIYTRNVVGIIERNEIKRKNILKLIETKRLEYYRNMTDNQERKRGAYSIRYEVYFFSSNMDHFMHGNANLARSKKQYAFQFAQTTGKDLNTFCSFINGDGSCKDMSYKGSWEYIQKGFNSVQRHTNLNVLIEKYGLDGIGSRGE